MLDWLMIGHGQFLLASVFPRTSCLMASCSGCDALEQAAPTGVEVNHRVKPSRFKPGRPGSRHARIAPVLLVLALAGCSSQSGPFAVFRTMRAKPPSPAPGLNAPFPNLATVPAKPSMLPTADQQQIRAQLEAANAAAQAQLQPVPPAPAAPPPPPPRQAPPLLIGFTPRSAIIPRRQRILLRNLAAGHGDASAILAAGFAPEATSAGLQLALLRALAIANELTSAGLPAGDIRLAALASGHGGFAELLHDPPPQPPPSGTKPKEHP